MMDELLPSVNEDLDKTHFECVYAASANSNLQYTIGLESNSIVVSGKITTPTLPKRLYLIFLLAELSQRAPTPIVNTLLNTVHIFGGQ